jgi:hypothetical protein
MSRRRRGQIILQCHLYVPIRLYSWVHYEHHPNFDYLIHMYAMQFLYMVANEQPI